MDTEEQAVDLVLLQPAKVIQLPLALVRGGAKQHAEFPRRSGTLDHRSNLGEEWIAQVRYH